MQNFIVVIVIALLVGCTTENKYHHVAEPIWNQLTPEQKQLLIDRDFEKELGDEEKN
jgi:hypothetical protein